MGFGRLACCSSRGEGAPICPAGLRTTSVLDVRIVTDRDTGRSKGFGFVDMADEATAKQAIEQLNGVEVGGRPLRVDEARPRGQSSRSTGFGLY